MQYFCSIICAAVMGVTTALPASAQADDYPDRPITIIVPFGGGSGSDATARYFGEKMSKILGASFIVENRPGAAGAIGMMAAKRAPADGYTIVQASISPLVVNQVLVKELGYDPVEEFVPLLGYGRNMNVLIAPIDSEIKNIDDLKRVTGQTGHEVNVGTYSTTLQLAAAWMGDELGVQFMNIPYKGQAQVINDLMGSQIDLALVDLGGASSLLHEGKVRAIAVTGETRSEDFPDVPTIKESGADDYVLYSWNAFYVRAEVPDSIRAKLSDAIKQVMTDPDTVENFYSPKGTEGVPLPAKQLRELQKEQIARFEAVVQKLGIEKN
ncbi:MAG: tripartite tricarboxylate transporter substrate binding protein [Burkholderiaceae bacterium]